MGTLTPGYVWGSTETVTNTKLGLLVSAGSVSGIVNADVDAGAAIANSKLNLASISQAISQSGGLTLTTLPLTLTSIAANMAKGSDIASATTTDIGAATGNYVHVTGTTTITGLGTVQSGTWRIVRFTGALTFTHNGTSLILPTGANITTAADDHAFMVSLGSGNWICASYQRKDGTALVATTNSNQVIQTRFTKSSAVAQSSGTAVDDDSIPTVTECPVIAALNTAITASSGSNTLIITVNLNLQWDSSGVVYLACVFKDSDADAVAMTRFLPNGSGSSPMNATIQFSISATDTSAHTYKLGLGGVSGGVITLNGVSGSRRGGGVLYSSMRIDEIKA